MDIRKVKKLIELLEASSVDEIEIKEGEESVRISRNTGAPVAMAAAPMPTWLIIDHRRRNGKVICRIVKNSTR